MAVRDFDPNEFDPSFFTPPDDTGDAGFDPSFFTPYRNDYRESGDALRLRQQAQREAEQQPDESTTLERLALGAGQGVLSLESGLGGLFNLAGLTPVGRWLQSDARERQANLSDVSATLAGQNPNVSREWAESFGGMAVQQVPTIIAGLLTRSPKVAAAVAAAQSAGQRQDEAEQAYQAQGFSPDEATARARIPAIASGAITGLLTRYMPGHLAEGVMSPVRSVSQGAIQSAYSAAKRITAEALGREVPEEVLDQVGQSFVAKLSYDPDKPMEEILMESWEAAGWGAGMAGAVGTIGEVVNRAAAGRMPEPQTGVNLRQQPPVQPPPVPMMGSQLTAEQIDATIRENLAQLQGRADANLQQAQFNPDYFEPASQPTAPLTADFLPSESDFEVPFAPPPQMAAPVQLEPSVTSPVPETIPAIPETTPPVAETIAPPVAANLATSETAASLIDDVKADMNPSVGTNRAGDYWRNRFNKSTEDQLVNFLKWTRAESDSTNPAQQWVNRFLGDHAAAALRQRGVPVDEIAWQLQNIPRPDAPTVKESLSVQPEPVKSDALRQYEGELENYKQASRDYQKARRAFRDRKVDEKSFLAASKSFDQAQAKRDRAERTYQKALKEETQTPSVKPRAKSESSYKRPTDILDDLERVGKIRRIKPGEQSEYADLWRAAQAAEPDYFEDSDTASNPDDAADSISGRGRPIDPESMFEEIIGARPTRKAHRDEYFSYIRRLKDEARIAALTEKQKENFDKIVTSGKERPNSKAVIADQLQPGDKFSVQGHRFTVEQVRTRADDETMVQSVRLKDDKKFGTQEVGPDTALEIDKRSLKKAASQPLGDADAFRRGSSSRETPRSGGGLNNPAFSLTVNPPEETEQVRQLRNEKTRIVSQALAQWASQHGLDYRVEVTPAVDANGQLTEMGARIGNLIEAAENADEKVLPHELAHIVFDALPSHVKGAIEFARRNAYKRLIESSQPVAPDERVEAGRMTSEEFQQSGLPIELYPLSSASEFFAHGFGNQFSQQALAEADPSLLGRLRIWIADLWRTLKRVLMLGNQMDQAVQDLIDGRLKFDPAIAAEQESKVRQSTFVTTAEESINAANLASSAIEQQIEGESQLAQAADITDLLDRFGGTSKAFDYGNWKAIRDTGEALNQSRENYRQMKTRLAGDPFRRARLAGEAGQSILRFGEILDQVTDESAKAFTKLTSRHFQDFIARVQAKSAQNQAAEAILATSKATFDSAIKEATAALKEEAKSDREMAVLQGEIRGIKEASESTVAMEQTLTNLVNALSMTPEGQNAMLTGEGGPRNIEKIYKETQRISGQPIHNQNLLKWASYIVAKNPKLTAKIHASTLAQQSGLRAQLNGMAKQLANDFAKDPVATVRRSLRDRERKVRNAMSAEFAFKQLEEELLSEMEPLIAAVDAGGIAAQIKADPQFQALRREILNDQTSFGGSPEPGKALRSAQDAGATITLPVVPGIAGAPPLPMSGATVGIGHEVLDGNVVTLRKRWDEQRKAIAFLENWLANPANADDPTRRYHAHNLDLLKNYYGGQQHLMPENQSPLWNRAYSIIGSAVSKSSSRLVGQARSVLNRADQMHKWSRDWFDRTVHALPMTQRAAIKSHGIKWNDLTGQSSVQANKVYQQKVGQELAASWQRQQGGHNVGDTLSSGEVVTREDIAHLEAQAKAGIESLNLAAKYDEQITKDARGLKKTSNYRSALRTSPFLVPRMFDYMLQAKAKAVGDAVKAGDAAAIETALNGLWPDIGLSMLVDRNPEFAKRTIFDGKGNGFDNAANLMRGNINSIPDIDALAAELAANSTMTVDQAKEIVLGEFGRIVSQWSAAVEEKVAAAEQGGKAGDAKNSFTQARGDALAPWTFYRTGFTTTDDVSNHAAGMQSIALDRVIAALEAIDKDLDRQQTDLNSKAMEFQRLGQPNAMQSAIKLKEVERRRGQTYDSWENLKERKANIQGVLTQLKNPAVSSTDFDLLFNRGAGALVGSLIGNIVTTMKNISSIFLGRQLRAAGMDEFNTTLKSMLFSKAEAAKILASFGFVGVPKSIGYLLRGMARGVPQLMKGNAREAYLSALRDVVRELSVNVPRRLKSVRDLEAAGMYQLPDKVAQFDNQILGSILYRGGIPANEFQGATKLGGYAAGLFEATLLAVANAGFPTMGDAAINGAMHNAVNSQWGPVQGMEDSLKKLFNEWSKGGYPRAFNLNDPANPINRLSPKELGLTEQTMSQLRRTYQLAGMSFDERAAAFMAELQNNPQAAQFLTTENRNALTETLINKMNRASFSNSPLKFKDGSFLSNMVRPLYGWSLRSFADWEESMAIPTATETGRMKLWATSMALAGVALAMTGAGGQLQDELMARLLKRGLYSQESQNRLPWEEQTPGRAVAGWARLGLESVPLLGIAGNLLIPANTPARASFEPTLALWEAGKSMAGWIHGIFASGDPMFGLPEMMAKFVPDSKIIINRLESQAGRREGSNAVADIKRFADPDLVRPAYKGAVARGIDEATPWKQRMDNAAYQRDPVAFRRAANEAYQANLRMGKKPLDAKKAVQSYWRSRDPETRALTRRQTPAEYQEMLRRAASVGKNHAQEIIQARRDWAQAGAMIGVHSRGGGTNRISLRAPSLSRVGRGMARY